MNGRAKPESAVKKPRSPTGALTPERIVRVASDFIDRNGLDGLTMRGIADELGCAHTALFWHFRSRDDLLRGVLQLAMVEIGGNIPTEGPWDERAKTICRRIRRQLQQHPAILTLSRRFPARGVSPAARALTQIAEEAGYSGLEAIAAGRMLLELIGGYSTSRGGEQEVEERLPAAFRDGALSIEDMEFIIAFSKVDTDSVFEAALEGVVGVLRRRTPILGARPE